MARKGTSVFSRRDGGPAADFFVAFAYLASALALIMVLVAAIGRSGGTAQPAAENDDFAPRIRALLDEHSEPAVAWTAAVQDVCNNPDLQAEGLAVDCTTGAITIGDDLFEDPSSPQLTEEGMRKMQLAIPALLSALRSREVVWNNLESIELRGHADPRARRDPYVTNLVGSQQRPLGVMIYLVSEWALADRDREDLERLAVISASSFSRPPEACPERTRACYPYWRRLEIIPTLRNAPLRDELTNLAEWVDALLPNENDEG